MKYIGPADKALILDRIIETSMTQEQYPQPGYELETFILRYALTYGDDIPAIAEMFHAFKAEFWEDNDG